MNKPILYSIALAAVVGAGYLILPRVQNAPTAPAATAALPAGAMVAVTPAALTGNEVLGETAFNAKCAACHGTNAAGTDGKAPPLIHKFYEPGHHGDQAFLMAVQNGVRAHHWPFGNMPPVEGLTVSDVANIVAYVRALQRANGID
ncbi:c-type cytochrome [Defluviimonas sp. SAOS-178_SWC]|uniref:c-type cytochrome n=1 Tax=Defluviimonas sp. SAOS-178_SWC TaxID=3121287 RepID=UPI003221D106